MYHIFLECCLSWRKKNNNTAQQGYLFFWEKGVTDKECVCLGWWLKTCDAPSVSISKTVAVFRKSFLWIHNHAPSWPGGHLHAHGVSELSFRLNEIFHAQISCTGILMYLWKFILLWETASKHFCPKSAWKSLWISMTMNACNVCRGQTQIPAHPPNPHHRHLKSVIHMMTKYSHSAFSNKILSSQMRSPPHNHPFISFSDIRSSPAQCGKLFDGGTKLSASSIPQLAQFLATNKIRLSVSQRFE